MADPINSKNFDIVAYSHLRWDYVYQRPQQILERIGQSHKVLYIEQPIDHVSLHGVPSIVEVSENITVLQPRIDHGKFLDEYEELTLRFMKRLNIERPVLWFYGPGFEKLTDRVPHSLVVYDCMDEHSAFKGTNEGIIRNEMNLLKKADVVFTGGKSLFEAKKEHNPNVHCFPSSVDLEHFRKSLDPETTVPEDLLSIPKPTVAYYGVIDERTDLDLLTGIADLMPDISFVMIGPVIYAKINADKLPERKNIYYLGGKPYADLPNYLKGIDICMMPFALNRSTQFISPTKTLEYMAGLKPIISTPVTDVVRDYSEMVYIVNNAEEFKKAVEYYLNETPEEESKRKYLEESVLRSTSWDRTVREMEDIVIALLP
jgi:glycosyltransferase involved in cell wall biosynthesis